MKHRMRGRFLCALVAAALCAALPAEPAADVTSSAKPTTIPRTPDGHPDLQGTWTNATITPLERPLQFNGRLNVTDAEAAAFEKDDARHVQELDQSGDRLPFGPSGSTGTGTFNALFFERGTELIRINGVKRTSLIIDPPDGRLPPITDEARLRNRTRGNARADATDVKHHPLSERCILGFDSTAGPPMLPVLYNSTYQIVQTSDTVMILVEMVHDVRIIRINGSHLPASVHLLLGDSIGHWDGDALIVDTTNFTNQTPFHGSTENLHVIERFERTGANQILYRATMIDPATFSKPWSLEYPFNAAPGPLYEYACHEGNYALPDILAGARKTDSRLTK